MTPLSIIINLTIFFIGFLFGYLTGIKLEKEIKKSKEEIQKLEYDIDLDIIKYKLLNWFLENNDLEVEKWRIELLKFIKNL